MGIQYVGTAGSEEIIFNGDAKISRTASGGVTFGSGVATDAFISNFLELSEITAPSNPAADKGRVYTKDDGGTTKLYFKDSAGTETNLLAVSEESPGGSTGYVQFNNASAFAGDSGLFWDNTNKRLGIGTITPECPLEVSSASSNVISMHSRYSASPADSALVYVRRARGTEGSETTVLNGDQSGGFVFRVYGTSWATVAAITSVVDGTVSGNLIPSNLVFSTHNGTAYGPRATLTPVGDLDFVDGSLKIGSYNGTLADGIIEYDGTNFRGRHSSGWVNLDTQGGSAAGADTQIQFNDGGSAFGADANFVWDKTNNRLGVGCTDPGFDIELSKDASNVNFVVSSYSSSSTIAGTFYMFRGRGTRASKAAVQSGDYLGRFGVAGYYDASSVYGSAFMGGYAAEAWSAVAHGTHLIFQVTATGATAISEGLRITADQQISTGGEDAPDVDSGGICINHGANDGYPLTFKNSDITHPFTTLAESDTYLRTSKSSPTDGGVNFIGFSTADIGLLIGGACATPGTSNTGAGCVMINGYNTNGTTGFAVLTDSQNIAVFRNYTTTKIAVKGSGDIITQAGIKIGAYGQSDTAGAIQWDGSNFQGFDGSVWVDLDAQGGSAAGADTQVQFNDGGSAFGAEATFAYNKTKNFLTVGTNSSIVINAGTQYHGLMLSHDYASGDRGGVGIELAGGIPLINFARANNTLASRTVVADADYIAIMQFAGFDGTDYQTGASIQVQVDGTPAANIVPTKINFVTQDSAGSSANALVLTPDRDAIVTGSLEVGAAEYTYWGDASTDGSWRFGRSGDDMILQKRESSSWVTKHTFAD